MLLPLDEVPRSRTASPPAPLAIRKAPSASVESIEPRPPRPCGVGRPKGRRRKNRRQSHNFFLAPAAPRGVGYLSPGGAGLAAGNVLYFGQNESGLSFERVFSFLVILLGEFSGAVLELQVAQVVVDGVAALKQLVQARAMWRGINRVGLNEKNEYHCCCRKRQARQKHSDIDARKGLDRSQEHLASSQHPIPRSPDRPASAPARAHLGRRWALREPVSCDGASAR